MRIESIVVHGLRTLNGGMSLAEKSVLVGPVGAGKTSTLDAIAFAVLGYVPRYGPRGTSALMSGDTLAVSLTLDDGAVIERKVIQHGGTTRSDVRFAEKGKPALDGSAAHAAIVALFGASEEAAAEALDPRVLLDASPEDRTRRVEALLAAASPDPTLIVAKAGALSVLRLVGGEKVRIPDGDVAALRTLAVASSSGLNPTERTAATSAWQKVATVLRERGPVAAFEFAKESKLEERKRAKELAAPAATPALRVVKDVAALRAGVEDLEGKARSGAALVRAREALDRARKASEEADRAAEPATRAASEAGPTQAAIDDAVRVAAEAAGKVGKPPEVPLRTVPKLSPVPELDQVRGTAADAIARVRSIEGNEWAAFREAAVQPLGLVVSTLRGRFGGEVVKEVGARFDALAADVDRRAGGDLAAARSASVRAGEALASLAEQAKRAEELNAAAVKAAAAATAAAEEEYANASAAYRERVGASNRAARAVEELRAAKARAEKAHGAAFQRVEAARVAVAAAERVVEDLVGQGAPDTWDADLLARSKADLVEAERAELSRASAAAAVTKHAIAAALERAYAAIEWACGKVRDDAVEDRSAPVVARMIEVLVAAGRFEVPYLRAGGRSGPEFGWAAAANENQPAKDRPLRSLSAGETAIFMAAFVVALARIRAPKVPIVLVEAEGIVGDEEVVEDVLEGLGSVEGVQVVMAGRVGTPPKPWAVVAV